MRDVPISVVFVHGLWLTGAESALMRRRITAAHGFTCHSFTYRTVGTTMSAVVASLTAFVRRIDAAQIHFVGHSLGGIVLHRYFETAPEVAPGRVVFLGSPTVKSKTVERVGRIRMLAPLVGKLVASELQGPCQREWRSERELGCIAGSRPVGLGRFFARFDEECDGTIGVSETKLPGHKHHLVLPVSHMGMLLSAEVARQVGEFLQNGKFSPR